MPITNQWRGVTKNNLPIVDGTNYVLNKWYHITQKITISEPASEGIGDTCVLQFHNPSTTAEATITLRMKNVQLEKGNIETGWKPSQKEQKDKIEAHSTKISEFTQDLDGFKTYVSETYVDESTVERINSRFEQTDSTIEMAFTRSAEYTNDSLDSVKDKFDDLNTYIRFDEEGMEIGKLGSNFKGKFTNDELAFYSGKDKVAYFNNSRMYVPDSIEVQGQMVVSDPLTDQFYRFLVRPNGHLSLMWKGE